MKLAFLSIASSRSMNFKTNTNYKLLPYETMKFCGIPKILPVAPQNKPLGSKTEIRI